VLSTSLRLYLSAELHSESLFRSAYSFLDDQEIKDISRSEREALGWIEDSTYVYGEISFDALVAILRSVRPQPGACFVDLGSGAGKACVVAATLFEFSRVIGIEALQGLHALSQLAWSKYKKLYSHLPGALPTDLTNIEFVRGSFLPVKVQQQHLQRFDDTARMPVVDWSQADVVFANSTCKFDEDKFAKISVWAAEVPSSVSHVRLFLSVCVCRFF
jgi:SAM-dependent methyltransferase